jgi:hypothetical protein
MRVSSPGPPGRADAAQWRRWVFPAAIGAGLVTLLALPRGAAPGAALSYTRFLADVSAGMVRAVTIGPAGQVTGSLAGGQLAAALLEQETVTGDQVRAPAQVAGPIPLTDGRPASLRLLSPRPAVGHDHAE